MGAYNGTIDEDALDFLADISGGDARHALNAIELGIMTTEPVTGWQDPYYSGRGTAVYPEESGDDMIKTVTITTIRFLHLSRVCGGQIRMRRSIIWQGCYMPAKSVTFIARRIMICASEDVGNADPQALVVAVMHLWRWSG